MPPGDPSHIGFPTNPRVTSNLDELRENEIWLGRDVDRGLLFLSTKGIWIWVGRMRNPLSLRCSLMEERVDRIL
jgi:hypothetical protein